MHYRSKRAGLAPLVEGMVEVCVLVWVCLWRNLRSNVLPFNTLAIVHSCNSLLCLRLQALAECYYKGEPIHMQKLRGVSEGTEDHEV